MLPAPVCCHVKAAIGSSFNIQVRSSSLNPIIGVRMKKYGNLFNRFRLLTAAIVFVSVPSLYAQYSAATLNGPWFTRDTAFDTVDMNNLGYMVFDGKGSVDD